MLQSMVGTLVSQLEGGKLRAQLVEYGFRDGNGYRYEAGSLDESIKGKSALIGLYGHSPTNPIGQWTNLQSNADGVTADFEFDEKYTFASQAKRMVETGVLSGISIGSTPIERSYGYDSEDRHTMFIKNARLVEASLVLAPANDDLRLNSFDIRGADNKIKVDSLTAILDALGLSRKEVESLNLGTLNSTSDKLAAPHSEQDLLNALARL